MKNTIVISLLAFFASMGCKKNDPLKTVIPQFFEFSVDGQHYYFTEDDTTEFILIPGFDFRSDKPDSLFYRQLVQIQILHPQPDGSAWGESIVTQLYGRFHKNQTSTEGNCQRLLDAPFNDLLQPGDREVPGLSCPDGFYGPAATVELVMNLQGGTDWSNSIGDSNCQDAPLDQSGSFFTIDSAAVYEHPVHGDGLMLSGRFEMNQISFQTGEVIRLEDGKFRLCAIKCR